MGQAMADTAPPGGAVAMGGMNIPELIQKNSMVLQSIARFQQNDIYIEPEASTRNNIAWLDISSKKVGSYTYRIDTVPQEMSEFVCLLDQMILSVTVEISQKNGDPLSGWTFILKKGSQSVEVPVMVRFLGVHSLFSSIQINMMGPFRMNWATSTDLFVETEMNKFYNTKLSNEQMGFNVSFSLETTPAPDLDMLKGFCSGVIPALAYMNENQSWFTAENRKALKMLPMTNTSMTIHQIMPHPLQFCNANRYSTGVEFRADFILSGRQERGFMLNPFVASLLEPPMDVEIFIPDGAVHLSIPYFTQDLKTRISDSPHLDMTVLVRDLNELMVRNTYFNRQCELEHVSAIVFDKEVSVPIMMNYIPRRVGFVLLPRVSNFGEKGFGQLDPRESVLRGIGKCTLSLMGNHESQFETNASFGDWEMVKHFSTFNISLKRGKSLHSTHEYPMDFDSYQNN